MDVPSLRFGQPATDERSRFASPPYGSVSGVGSAFCPHCGYDLARDKPLTIGPVSFDPLRGILVHGKLVPFTPSERMVAQSLMKAGGAWVSKDVLLERAGSDAMDAAITVFVTRIRATLRRAGAGECIETGYGLGYRWRSEEAASPQVSSNNHEEGQ